MHYTLIYNTEIVHVYVGKYNIICILNCNKNIYNSYHIIIKQTLYKQKEDYFNCVIFRKLYIYIYM